MFNEFSQKLFLPELNFTPELERLKEIEQNSLDLMGYKMSEVESFNSQNPKEQYDQLQKHIEKEQRITNNQYTATLLNNEYNGKFKQLREIGLKKLKESEQMPKNFNNNAKQLENYLNSKEIKSIKQMITEKSQTHINIFKENEFIIKNILSLHYQNQQILDNFRDFIRDLESQYDRRVSRLIELARKYEKEYQKGNIDDYDCGVYVCYNIALTVNDIPIDKNTYTGNDIVQFRKRMYYLATYLETIEQKKPYNVVICDFLDGLSNDLKSMPSGIF